MPIPRLGLRAALALTAACLIAQPAAADLFIYIGDDGLSGEAEFTLVNPTTLQIRLRNTSTGVPAGFDGSDSILTSLAFDLGLAGVHGSDPSITGGTVVIGPSSNSVNFDSGSYGPGTDVGGEWGFGNGGTTNIVSNYISSLTAGVTAFGGANLDGPVSLDGPQGGLAATPLPVSLGGQGAIQNEIIATLTLSAPILNLNFLYENGTLIEFGSDAAFVPGQVIPAPPAALVLAGLCLAPRRRRR